MKKSQKNFTIFSGVICVLLFAASAWYTITFNDARWIAPMDYASYTFRPRDLPMLLSEVLLMAYLLYLAVLLARSILAGRLESCGAAVSRTVNPKLGCLGFAGFLGCLGFWTYRVDGSIFPFAFFMFFGFFGFFFEGKRSNTLMDERYRENQLRARSAANRIALAIIFLATVILGQVRVLGSLEYTFITYVSVVSLAMALNGFLSEFLLYRYDHDGPVEESEA